MNMKGKNMTISDEVEALREERKQLVLQLDDALAALMVYIQRSLDRGQEIERLRREIAVLKHQRQLEMCD